MKRSPRLPHIKPGIILIYRKPDDANLELGRLGSDSELGF
jgi:mRNA-degrading endonuclease YafQ of YafQ-DinJ toxin-antitoxin module